MFVPSHPGLVSLPHLAEALHIRRRVHDLMCSQSSLEELGREADGCEQREPCTGDSLHCLATSLSTNYIYNLKDASKMLEVTSSSYYQFHFLSFFFFLWFLNGSTLCLVLSIHPTDRHVLSIYLVPGTAQGYSNE